MALRCSIVLRTVPGNDWCTLAGCLYMFVCTLASPSLLLSAVLGLQLPAIHGTLCITHNHGMSFPFQSHADQRGMPLLVPYAIRIISSSPQSRSRITPASLVVERLPFLILMHRHPQRHVLAGQCLLEGLQRVQRCLLLLPCRGAVQHQRPPVARRRRCGGGGDQAACCIGHLSQSRCLCIARMCGGSTPCYTYPCAMQTA